MYKYLYRFFEYYCCVKRDLTPKQLEVLTLMAEGFSSQEIAENLGNSKKTIDNMRFDMLERSGAKNVAHLVTYGFRNNLLK